MAEGKGRTSGTTARATAQDGVEAIQQGRDALQRGAEQMRGATEGSARISRELIERAGQNFEVMRRIGETLTSGVREATTDLTEYVRHTAQRQQEMVQALGRARSPEEVLEIQTRHFQDNLRELLGLSERLARNSAETARRAGQGIGGDDGQGGSKA